MCILPEQSCSHSRPWIWPDSLNLDYYIRPFNSCLLLSLLSSGSLHLTFILGIQIWSWFHSSDLLVWMVPSPAWYALFSTLVSSKTRLRIQSGSLVGGSSVLGLLATGHSWAGANDHLGYHLLSYSRWVALPGLFLITSCTCWQMSLCMDTQMARIVSRGLYRNMVAQRG